MQDVIVVSELKEDVLQIILQRLCNFCTAAVFKSFRLGTWIYTRLYLETIHVLRVSRLGSPASCFGERNLKHPKVVCLG